MLENWNQAYNRLTDFITNHSEIRIETSVTRIGEAVSKEFYQLFRVTNEAFINEQKSDLLKKAEVLSKNYLDVEEEIIRLLGIKRVNLLPRVENFLRNPREELVKELKNPLFNLLKGKIDITKYKDEALNNLVSYLDLLYQQGYETWIILTLMKLLQADKLYRVEADQFDDDELYIHGDYVEIPVQSPKELTELSFRHYPTVGIVVADQIIHSVKNDHYVSFRLHVIEPKGKAPNKSKKVEWLPLPFDAIINLGSNIILVYTDKVLGELSLIADSQVIARPDLIIDCIGLTTSFNENSLANLKKYTKEFKPRLGTYLIFNQPILEGEYLKESNSINVNNALIQKNRQEKGSDAIFNGVEIGNVPRETEVDIHLIPVGFDQSKLEQIVILL